MSKYLSSHVCHRDKAPKNTWQTGDKAIMYVIVTNMWWCQFLFQAPMCSIHCLRHSGGSLYIMYKDHEDTIKWGRNDIASMLSKTGGDTKAKTSYYNGLNGRNPDAAFTHEVPGWLFDENFFYFIFGMLKNLMLCQYCCCFAMFSYIQVYLLFKTLRYLHI